jgi:mannose-6-phosphate isomerase-like protein (cupin superfamily)
MKTDRTWGYYCVLHEVPGMKVKELTVNPGCSLSMQRHFKRSEHWQVSEGTAQVDTESEVRRLNLHDTIEIPVGTWHRLYNITDKPCRIVEIQYGESCVEEDIERK